MDIIKRFTNENLWGLSTAIDLYNVNKSSIKDPKFLEGWIKDLVEFIGMKAYGEPIIARFGNQPHLEGYSVVQLIETSCITAHFDEYNGSAYIDVFSCAPYDPQLVAEYCSDYFETIEYEYSYLERK